MSLIKQVKKLPESPGVYLFLGKKGTILYVGRAINLKKRALQYFQKNLDPRISEMVDRSFGIRHVKTDTVLEAIILEANLIKKHWPKYNVKEKDNRSFIYIVVPKTDYPRPFVVRQRELEKFPSDDRVFGPYQSLSLVQNALRIIRRIFPYSKCRPFSGKPCFDRQIGLCPGLCTGEVSKKDYQKNIKNIILLLSGKKKKILKQEGLRHIEEVSLLTQENYNISRKPQRIEGYDISHLTGKEPYGSMVVFIDGEPDNSLYRLFKIKQAPKNDDIRALEEVMERRFNHFEWSFPDLVLVDGGRPQVSHIFKFFEKKNINIPLVGISKYGGDKLVFSPKTKKNVRELIESTKDVLLAVREESHRFSLKWSRKKRRIRS
jgi:excinuclease ABC subunit C